MCVLALLLLIYIYTHTYIYIYIYTSKLANILGGLALAAPRSDFRDKWASKSLVVTSPITNRDWIGDNCP